MKGVFLDAATIDPCGIDFSPLKQVLPQWQFFDSTSHQSELRNRIKQAELVITNKVAISEDVLKKIKNNKETLKKTCSQKGIKTSAFL